MTALREDIHFTVLTPEIMPGFQYSNTEQVLYKQPTYPNEMRQHFDTYQFKKIVDFKIKIGTLYIVICQNTHYR